MYPENQTVLEGKTTNISCYAFGVAKPALTWKFKDGDLPSVASVRDIQGGSVLLLQNATKNMEGMYKCIATNKGGAATSNATLRVLGSITEMFA